MSGGEIAQSSLKILGYGGDHELDGGGLRIFLMGGDRLPKGPKKTLIRNVFCFDANMSAMYSIFLMSSKRGKHTLSVYRK